METITKDFLVVPCEGIEAFQNPKISSIERSTSSESSASIVKAWITSCIENHLFCQLLRRRDVPFVPTRLLDTEQRDDSDWRLWINTPDKHQPKSYMTLSHCWGTASFLKLENLTMRAFQDGLPLSELPKTFQDAVHIARRLGERYLWIDSICIIQDSLEDWQEQSLLMREVYSQSICNIPATGAADSSEGCFVDRQESDLVCTFSKNLSPFFNQEQAIVDLQLWSDEVEHTKLSQRGWVVQERLLAPRTVHFGFKQLLWECSERNACETYPEMLPSPYHRNYMPSLRSLFYTALRSRPREDDEVGRERYWSRDVERFWATFIDHYSRCGITNSEDKLVAVAAIVFQLQEVTRDECCAGLWRRHLPRQLLWNVKAQRQADGSSSKRPSPYRAPTWSWASIDGLIDTYYWVKLVPGPTDIDLIQVVDIAGSQSFHTSQTPKTSIEALHLSVRSILFPAYLTQLNLSAPFPNLSSADASLLVISCHIDVFLHMDAERVTCMPVQMEISMQPDLPSPEIKIRGLVLERVDSRELIFRRLGIFTGWISLPHGITNPGLEHIADVFHRPVMERITII